MHAYARHTCTPSHDNIFSSERLQDVVIRMELIIQADIKRALIIALHSISLLCLFKASDSLQQDTREHKYLNITAGAIFSRKNIANAPTERGS